ncbi:hypothetical protein [Pedobacter sp.]|uniref:hypothetical protein n=1 Tax=Pedobacter sp. TaxID=1411316 RepID=UPI003BADB011
MKQIIADKLGNLVEFDFSRFKLPSLVTKLKPLLFQSNNCYYALLLLPDLEKIEGSGNSPEDALIDWNDKICEQLTTSSALQNKLMEMSRNQKM